MACSVYCLVPRPEQLDPLLERLKKAGVSTRDIAVVPRSSWQRSSGNLAALFPDPSRLFSNLVPGFWGLSLASAALWWELAADAGRQLQVRRPAAAGKPGGRASSAVIIPLDLYETRRRQLLGLRR